MDDYRSYLRDVGGQLDAGVFPDVYNGGIVAPSRPTQSSSNKHEVRNDVERWTRGSEARSWERAAGRQGPTGGQGSAGTRAPLVGQRVLEAYEQELADVRSAYPGARLWRQGSGIWLRTEAQLIPGLDRRAIFLTVISPSNNLVRSWGFWRHGRIISTWIGPRHTNFPDGSVCAYEPRDRTWVLGEPLIDLLDIYSVWAMRHLYLESIGRWPGPQAVGHPYERIVELRADELCGCGNSRTTYGECCWRHDRSRDRLADAVDFLRRLRFNPTRAAPISVTESVCHDLTPPDLDQFLERIGASSISPGGLQTAS